MNTEKIIAQMPYNALRLLLILTIRHYIHPSQKEIFLSNTEAIMLLGITLNDIIKARNYLIEQRLIEHRIVFNRDIYFLVQRLIPKEIEQIINPPEIFIGSYDLKYALRVWQIVTGVYDRQKAASKLGVKYKTYLNWTKGYCRRPSYANMLKIIRELHPWGIKINEEREP